MSALDGYDRLEVPDRAAWRCWLADHHATSPGIWLVCRKRGSPGPGPGYDEAVEEALCYGWIDSLVKKDDQHRFRLVFTPRKPGSTWSRSNKERVARLEAAGSIAPPGAGVIAAARADGSWTQLDGVEALIVPDDLAAALAARAGATAGFDAMAPSLKKRYLWWVESARRPATRRRRIAEIVERAVPGSAATSPPTDP